MGIPTLIVSAFVLKHNYGAVNTAAVSVYVRKQNSVVITTYVICLTLLGITVTDQNL